MTLRVVDGTVQQTAEEASGPFACRTPLLCESRSHGRDEGASDEMEQTSYGPWGALFDSAERESCLVVMSEGGRWPSWLSSELPGNSSSMIVVQRPGESAASLSARAKRLVSESTTPVANVVWLRSAAEPDNVWALSLVGELGDYLTADCRVRMSSGYDSSFEALSGDELNIDQDSLPAARHVLLLSGADDEDSIVA